MATEMTQVLVFKTNVSSETQKTELNNFLSTHPLILEWSVDTEDIDRVLRVVSQQLQARDVIELLTVNGFECCELN